MSKQVFFQHVKQYFDKNALILVKLIALVVVFCLLYFNKLVVVADWCNMSSLHQYNQSYLSNVRSLATTDLLNFAELLTATEIARSSTVGISFFASFNVDVGNVLHSFSTLLEKGIDVQIVSLAAIDLLTLLDTLAYWLSPFLFKLSILVSIINCSARLLLMPTNILSKIHHAGRLMIVLFLLAHIAFPYSLHLSSSVSKVLTQEKRHSISRALQHTHDELVPAKKYASFKDHAESSLRNLKSVSGKHITHKVHAVSKHVYMSISLNVFDLLIMPGLLLLFLYRACAALIPLNQRYSSVKKRMSGNEHLEIKNYVAPIENVINSDKVKFEVEPDHLEANAGLAPMGRVDDYEKESLAKDDDASECVTSLSKQAIIKV